MEEIRIRKQIQELEYLKLAIKSEPEGIFCFFCGNLNDFADDLGFFYIMSPFHMFPMEIKPCCEKCYHKYSDTHIRRYGLGDR